MSGMTRGDEIVWFVRLNRGIRSFGLAGEFWVYTRNDVELLMRMKVLGAL